MILPPSKSNKTSLISWAFYDWASSAFSSIIETFVLPAYFVKAVSADQNSGVQIWGLTLGLIGVVIALCGPILGSIADNSGNKKKWIGSFTLISVICTAFMWQIKPNNNDAVFALILFSFATIGTEFAYIFYNSMLPDLAAPSKIGRWSGWGWGLGYFGGMLSLIAALVLLINPATSLFAFDAEKSEAVRASFVLAALWYLVFSLPLFLFTPKTPPIMPIKKAIRQGLKQLYNTIKKLSDYSDLFRFFIARMFFIDGLLTLFAFGGIYAAERFDMNESKILLFGISLNITAGIGSALFALLDDWIGPKKIMIASLVALIILGLFTLLAQTEMQFWTGGMLLGIFVGPVQASSRSYLAKVAPRALMNEMFGFFTLSGKATSFLGPFVVSLAVALTGSLVLGMASIIAFFIVGLAILLTIKPIKNL